MNLNEMELKDLWSRNDEYFQFRFDEFKTFGSRLKKWRQLNSLTQKEMAQAIYDSRCSFGLPCSTVDGITRTYGKWENNSDGFDTLFSLSNLRIIKKMLNVDYEFLFCECDTPHRFTKQITAKTALSVTTIEKLSSLSSTSLEGDASANYACFVLSALNMILADDDLLCYLSYFLTHIACNEQNDSEDFDTISILKPINGIEDEDAILDGKDITIDTETQLSVFLITIASKLCNLRDSKRSSTTSNTTIKKDSTDSLQNDIRFGERLRKCRIHNKYTQNAIADKILIYKKKNGLKTLSKKSIIRTYQNWESKTDPSKDFRLSIQDIKMLKSILDCDYEYLFGETYEFTISDRVDMSILGLSVKNISNITRYTESLYKSDDSVPAYASQILSSINLIISDNDLLSDLTYFLTDIVYYPRLNFCSVLKPIDFLINTPADIAYTKHLFDNKELRNVFLPNICDHLKALRERYQTDK